MDSRRTITGVLCSSIACLLLAGACSVKAPPSNTWTLAAARRDLAPDLQPDGPSLGLRRFSSTAEARSTSLAYRTDGGRQLLERPYDSWSDYPDRMLEELTHATLAASGRFSAVARADELRDRDVTLSCHVLDFSQWAEATGQEARVEMRCTLSDADDELLATVSAVGTEPISSSGAGAAVAAFERAARSAIDEIVDAAAGVQAPATN